MIADVFEDIPVNGQLLKLRFIYGYLKPIWLVLSVGLNCGERGKSRYGTIRNAV